MIVEVSENRYRIYFESFEIVLSSEEIEVLIKEICEMDFSKEVIKREISIEHLGKDELSKIFMNVDDTQIASLLLVYENKEKRVHDTILSALSKNRTIRVQIGNLYTIHSKTLNVLTNFYCGWCIRFAF